VSAPRVSSHHPRAPGVATREVVVACDGVASDVPTVTTLPCQQAGRSWLAIIPLMPNILRSEPNQHWSDRTGTGLNNIFLNGRRITAKCLSPRPPPVSLWPQKAGAARSRPGHEVYGLTPERLAARRTATAPPWAPRTAVGPGRTRSRGNTRDAQSLLVRFNAAYGA
jgi:hypothetical protein